MTKTRLLFVGTDPIWRSIAVEAANQLGGELELQPNVKSALALMLPPSRAYDHVLAVGPLRARAMDALAGMLDEVTLRPTPLVLLGCVRSGSSAPAACVEVASVQAVLDALTRSPAAPQQLGPLEEDDLAASLHAGALRMRFQPILRAADLAPIGLEALARLHHGKRGILHPKDFIPLAVASGRERVLTAIASARTFLDIGARLRDTGLFVSLNLPLTTVMHVSAVQRGRELCTVAGLSPTDIVIEVLESRTAPNLSRLRDALMEWREAGFRTAIDDAGPALPHWRDFLELPFDVIKLDGSMVADPTQHPLLETIIQQARSRGMLVVAEGIQDQPCFHRVQALGVDALQGFLFSRPLPALAVPIWLEQWTRQV